ncbi:MAG: Ycf34 family protein [Cyanobacteriota bacterium]
MCICVDCHWVDRCQAYHAVERQHSVPHLCPLPDFVPDQPRIHVQVLDLPAGGVGVEWDVRGCVSFRSAPGRWLALRPGSSVPR